MTDMAKVLDYLHTSADGGHLTESRLAQLDREIGELIHDAVREPGRLIVDRIYYRMQEKSSLLQRAKDAG